MTDGPRRASSSDTMQMSRARAGEREREREGQRDRGGSKCERRKKSRGLWPAVLSKRRPALGPKCAHLARRSSSKLVIACALSLGIWTGRCTLPKKITQNQAWQSERAGKATLFELRFFPRSANLLRSVSSAKCEFSGLQRSSQWGNSAVQGSNFSDVTGVQSLVPRLIRLVARFLSLENVHVGHSEQLCARIVLCNTDSHASLRPCVPSSDV